MPREAKGGGTRGPIAAPPNLRLAGALPSAAATDDPQPRSAAELPAVSYKPEMPTGMTVTEQRLWTQLVEALDAAGLVGGCDALTVELAVRHYAAAVAAHKSLKRNGPTIYDEKNKRYAKNPASQLFKEHSAEYREYAKLLGLSFAARARIQVPERAGGGSGSSGAGGNPFQPPTASAS